MNDSEMTAFVLEFVRQVDDLQRTFRPLLDAARGGGVSEVFAQYRAHMEEVYRAFLTPRRRNCLYFGIGDPPAFAGLEHPAAVFSAERRENRAAVTALAGAGSVDYRFQLVCRGGLWRIDSLKQRYRSGQKTHNWCYGSF